MDNAGNSYVADYYANEEFKLEKGAKAPIMLPLNDIKGPGGVAVDTKRNVYVAAPRTRTRSRHRTLDNHEPDGPYCTDSIEQQSEFHTIFDNRHEKGRHVSIDGGEAASNSARRT